MINQAKKKVVEDTNPILEPLNCAAAVVPLLKVLRLTVKAHTVGC